MCPCACRHVDLLRGLENVGEGISVHLVPFFMSVFQNFVTQEFRDKTDKSGHKEENIYFSRRLKSNFCLFSIIENPPTMRYVQKFSSTWF